MYSAILKPALRRGGRLRGVLLGLPCALLAADAVAQVRVRPAPPVGFGGALLEPPTLQEDPGRPVHMLESPNIDRFLRRAQHFLAMEDFRGAVTILQDVIEGRTLEDLAADPDPEPNAGDPEATPEDPVWADWVENAAHAVFSDDDRLYRPVRRLCHELLASMPQAGIDLYRATYEVEAERALAAASDVHDFEKVYTTWFMTQAAARAMQAAGDLLLDRGRFRAAIQTYRHLTEVYPARSRAAAGISDRYVRFKIALAFGLLGDRRMAAQTLAELAADDPQGSIRLMGELRSIAELQADELFAGGATASRRADDQAVRVLRDPGETLVPLWEHRYEDQHPYRANRAASQSRGGTFVVNQGGSAMSATPKHSAYVPGTSVQFVGDRIVFMDHFRLRLHDRLSGRMLGEGDGPEAPAPPKQNSPHDRIPAYDFASLRVAHDDERLFAVIGPKSRNLTGMNAVLRNRLAAYARDDVSPLWSTDRNETALKELTFLAAPTVFGSRLLVPVLQRGTYGLLCLDSATGGVLFHVRIHRAGSDMARPPASMVEVEAGIAYLLTNAGALASIDAHTGSLRWIRRYERAHPFREPVRAKPVARSQNPFGGRFFVEQDFYGFAPGELVVEDGLVIFAPCDGRVMHCIDGASGEPVWMASRLDPHSFLLGHNRDQLFVGGPDYVIGIDLRSGLRLWQDDLPSFSGSNRWRGRGLATDDLLLVPGKRQILVKHLAGDGGWSTLELPAFTYGRESLAGSFNLFLDGPYLAAAYEGGVELYSTTEALLALADRSDDLIERAVYQAQAGELLAAVGTLEAIDRDALDERRKLGVEQRMLSWASELALAMAVRGARDESLDLLARCRQHLHDTRYVQRWHLARIEVFQALGDLESVGDEQQALYALMGRKG